MCFCLLGLPESHQVLLNLHVSLLFLSEKTNKSPCCCFVFPLFTSPSLSLSSCRSHQLSNTVLLACSPFPSLACLQLVCCSQRGAGVQTLQPSAASRKLPEIWRWFHPRRIPKDSQVSPETFSFTQTLLKVTVCNFYKNVFVEIVEIVIMSNETFNLWKKSSSQC